MKINLLRRVLYYMSSETHQHASLMLGALTEGEQVCIAVKTMIHPNLVGINTLRRWIAEGSTLTEGYERLYRHFQADALFELAAFFTLLVRKGVDPDDLLASCRLLEVRKCQEVIPYLEGMPDNPVLLSRPQD